MKKAIKDSKWYWWIPIVYVFYIGEIIDWTFESDDVEERNNRHNLATLLIYPNIFVTIGIILYFEI